MQDDPEARLILVEVRDALYAGVPAGFQQRVAGNAVALALREDTLAAGFAAGEATRLRALLGRDAPLAALNQALAAGLRDGSVAADDPIVQHHLIRTTVEKMRVDQPQYPAFRQWWADTPTDAG
ncbi:DUF6285 domain-containing protein [Parapedomonas caeni]